MIFRSIAWDMVARKRIHLTGYKAHSDMITIYYYDGDKVVSREVRHEFIKIINHTGNNDIMGHEIWEGHIDKDWNRIEYNPSACRFEIVHRHAKGEFNTISTDLSKFEIAGDIFTGLRGTECDAGWDYGKDATGNYLGYVD